MEKDNDHDRIFPEELKNIVTSYIDISEIQHVMEIGALDGISAMNLKTQFPNANVYAIEGLPDHYNEYLKDNKYNIIGYNAVICDHNGNIDFHVNTMRGSHGIYQYRSAGDKEIINVPCITLDTFCEKNNIPRIDFLKIDAEGSSLDILKGSTKMMANIKFIFPETETYEFFYGQSLQDEVFKYLNECNFEMIRIGKWLMYADTDIYQCYSVWINKKIIK